MDQPRNRTLFKSLRINGSQNRVKTAGTRRISAWWCAQVFGLLPIDAPNFSESIGEFSDHLVGLEGCSWQKRSKKVNLEHFLDRNASRPGSLRFGQWHTNNFVWKKLGFVKSVMCSGVRVASNRRAIQFWIDWCIFRRFR